MLQVGTYIGERLIYAPSIGFCILVAELLANWLETLFRRSCFCGTLWEVTQHPLCLLFVCIAHHSLHDFLERGKHHPHLSVSACHACPL